LLDPSYTGGVRCGLWRWEEGGQLGIGGVDRTGLQTGKEAFVLFSFTGQPAQTTNDFIHTTTMFAL